VSSAVLTDVEKTMATLQNILPMALLAKFTLKSSPSTMKDTLKAARMNALMMIFELCAHFTDSTTALRTGQTWRISIDNFFGSLYEPAFIGLGTSAVFPLCTAKIAKFCFASTSDCLLACCGSLVRKVITHVI
jgi:hypothetical protein